MIRVIDCVSGIETDRERSMVMARLPVSWRLTVHATTCLFESVVRRV
jgi:hypothetical protein